MMSKLINISKYASGSWVDNIGDTTLFYSGESSRHAKDVEGFFLDNPPRLSASCASLVWRYYQDTDKYLLIHVQGSHVVNRALGRNYPFRAAYEISRKDINDIHFNIPAIFDAVPRIKSMKGGRIPLETTVNSSTPWPQGSDILRDNIEQAILSGKQLYVELNVKDELYREDGVFDAPELKILLGSIGDLPDDIRRYATFGFCVDGLFEPVLDNVVVVIYQKGRNINIPSGAVITTWTDAISSNVVRPSSTRVEFSFPGANESLMNYDQLQAAISVSRKNPSELQCEEWKTWLAIGGQLSKLRVDNWKSFSDLYSHMDADTRKQFRNLMMAKSVTWSIAGLTHDLYNLMATPNNQNGITCYSEDQKRTLQKQALVSFLSEEGKYDFLFPKGVLPADLRCKMNSNLLTTLEIKSKGDVERWYNIFKKYDRAGDVHIQMVFNQLFIKYALPSLNTLQEIMAYMKEFPFIPAEEYTMPPIHKLPQDKELKALNAEQEAVIRNWVDICLNSNSFRNIYEVITILLNINSGVKVKEMDVQTLKAMQPDTICSLMIAAEGDKLENCECLLKEIMYLKKSDFLIGEVVFMAVWKALFGDDNNPCHLIQEDLEDVCEWDIIESKYERRYPQVYTLVKIWFREWLNSMQNIKLEQMAKNYLQTYSPSDNKINDSASPTVSFQNSSSEKGAFAIKPFFASILQLIKPRSKSDSDFSDQEYHADYSLFNLLIETMKTKDMNTKDFERRLKEFKAVQKGTNVKFNNILALCCSFIAGVLVCIMGLWAFNSYINSSVSTSANQSVIGSRNPMIILADSLENNMNKDSIEKFVVDNQEYIVLFDSISSLIPISKAYYADKIYDIATAYLEIRDSMNVQKDTVEFMADKPLLEVANKKGCRVSGIKIENVTVDIPHNDLADNDSIVDMTTPRYYLKVTKYISERLPNSLSERVAY